MRFLSDEASRNTSNDDQKEAKVAPDPSQTIQNELSNHATLKIKLPYTVSFATAYRGKSNISLAIKEENRKQGPRRR